MELLEKRVKSRFSHRQIYLVSPGAPISNVDSYAESDGVESINKSRPFDQYCQICENLLTIDIEATDIDKNLSRSRSNKLKVQIKEWNDHVTHLMSDEIVIDSLRQAWSISVSIRRLINLLVSLARSTKASYIAMAILIDMCLSQ